MCTRQLLGFPKRTQEEMLSVVRHIPYCGMVTVEEDPETKTWKVLPLPPSLQMKHESAHEFDARSAFY